MNINYELNDIILYRNSVYIFESVIKYIDENAINNYKYMVESLDLEDNSKIWIREEDIVGFSEKSPKYIYQEVNKLLQKFSKDEIINTLNNIE